MNTPCPGTLEAGFALFHQLAESLGHAVDARDAYTSTHSDQVAEICRLLVMALGLPSRALNVIHLAGHLHDIGKIGIPDAILRKQGPLDEEESRLMRLHPEIGARILKPVQGFNEPGGVSEIVLHHHEKFDGSGYPNQLYGEAIPLGARIAAVADTYSALVQDRPYRPGRSHELALYEIYRHSGSQFDPQVVQALRECAAKILQLEQPQAPSLFGTDIQQSAAV